MDPRPLSGDDWAHISRLMVYLFAFTGLGLTSALGFLLGHAIIPSLVENDDAPSALSTVRFLAYPVSAVALVLTAYALVRAVALALGVAERIYPRLWI